MNTFQTPAPDLRMSGHHPHHVSVIHSRASVIRNNDSESDHSDKLISYRDNDDKLISLSDLNYSDPNDPEWRLPQKRKVLFINFNKVYPYLSNFIPK